jgi:hypothetical protein
MQQEVQVPSREELEGQLTQMVMQRSQLKDQIEQIEKQLPVLNGMVQLLQAQEAKAEQEAAKAD